MNTIHNSSGGEHYKELIKKAFKDGAEVVFLYFSAHWCPPCKQFTPLLANLYKDINKNNKRFEIIFVSLDKT